MKAVLKHTNFLCLCVLAAVFAFGPAVYAGQPLKVFILAGQSNMEGHGEISPVGTQGTLEYIANADPATFGHLKDGSDWAVRDDVWIWYKRGGTTVVKGGLSAGYGVGSNDEKVGPELQFGHVIGDFYDGPVLLIKIAWGGKSLYVDFRPPSSGWPKTPTEVGDMGYYYQEMMNIINDFKADPQSYYPDYNVGDGYEFVGFGWHQGWNDRDTSVFYDAYEENMVNFIKDVRRALDKPNLPFAIATTGMEGGTPDTPLEFAQLAVGEYDKHPEFTGNVFVDDTRGYWSTAAQSPSDNGYHWNNNAKSYYLIGNGLAEAMKDLLVDPDAPVIDSGVDKITWSGETVTMVPNVVERVGTSWTDLTYKWTAIPDAGVDISNDEALAPTVTINGSTDNPSTVVLVLEVNKSGRSEPGVKNAIKIDVYDTACKATIGKGLAEDNPTDLDGDCLTNLADFAMLALQWLNGEVLPASVRK